MQRADRCSPARAACSWVCTCPLARLGTAVVWWERRRPVCTDTHVGMHMPERRHFSCSPRCVVVRKEPGWSGALQQLPSQARSCDMHWGTNPALDTPFPKVQKEWRKQGSRPEWCSQPCPAILHFLSALPWESSNEAETQNRGRGGGGRAMLLPCVPAPHRGTWRW